MGKTRLTPSAAGRGLLLVATCLIVFIPAPALAQSIPSPSRMFDNEKTSTTTPSVTFSSTVGGGGELLQYEVEWDTVRGFIAADPAIGSARSWADSGFLNLDNGADVDPFNSGDTIQFTFPAGALTDGQTYWWRVRSRRSDTLALSAWSTPRTFTVDTAQADASQWHQTTSEQFVNDTLTGAVTGRESPILRVIDSGATSPADIDPVDIDGDGDTDVVTAAYSSDQFAWYENDGSTPPVWTLRVIDNNVANTQGAIDIEAADVDGDGDMDVVTAANIPDQFAWYENDGSTPPVWTLRVIDNNVTNTDGALDVEAVDLDRDGDMDVLTAALSSNQFAWYENDGSTPPVWTLHVIDNSITNPRDIEAADVDGDGDMDVVTAAAGSDQFAWYENDGSTPPVWTLRIIDNTLANADYAQSIDPVDLDGDGDIDVVTAAGVSDQFAWYENDGSSPPVWTLRVIDNTANADSARRIHAVDFDGDGDTDVVTVAVIPDQFAWYENDGSSPPVWTLRVIDNTVANTDGANDIDPVDLDGDGDMDVVTSAQQTNTFAWYEMAPHDVRQTMPTVSTNTGITSPTAAGTTWTNPTNAFSNDGSYAESDTATSNEVYSSFGFSIPAGVTIDGIEVGINAWRNNTNRTVDANITLSRDGGTFNSSTYSQAVTVTADPAGDQVLGGSGDLWGLTGWTADHLSNANFRVRIEGAIGAGGGQPTSLRLDHLWVRVSYTTPAGEVTSPLIAYADFPGFPPGWDTVTWNQGNVDGQITVAVLDNTGTPTGLSGATTTTGQGSIDISSLATTGATASIQLQATLDDVDGAESGTSPQLTDWTVTVATAAAAPAITARETIDSDADGRVDHIKITTDQALNDTFGDLTMTVSGYTVIGYVTQIGAGGVNDNVFYIQLTESGTPDTGARPTVLVTANTLLTDFGGSSSLVPDPPPDSKIAFESNRDVNFEIYVMDADGSNPTRLTNHAATEGQPAWSSDGSQIAFTSDRDGNYEIYVMDADGSNQTRLTNNPADERQPAWSPDGSKIAFVTNRDGNNEIYVMDADGSNPINLTNNAGADYGPAWSPDGSRIAFRTDRDGNSEIYVMDADGSNPINLTNNAANDMRPTWSPDGSRIAFHSDRDGNNEIYVMDADGSNPTRLTNNGAADQAASWSPDGSKIAFQTDRDGSAEIYIMDADGSNQTNLTNDPASDFEPAWWQGPSTLAIDSAPPVLLAAPSNQLNGTQVFQLAGERVDFVFSETLSALPTEAQLEAAWSVANGATDGDNLPSIGGGVDPFSLATTSSLNNTIRVSFGAGNTANADLLLVGTHTAQVSNGTNITDLAGNPAATTAAAVPITGTGYSYYKPIIIDRGQIAVGTCGATLTDFPMLFSSIDPDLAHTSSGGDVTDLEGDDIIFRAHDAATCGAAPPCTLDHEIEKYDNATGELVAWVRIPSLNTAAAASDTVIFLYYGDSTVTSPTENPAGVWDANYAGVWHLGEGDSTSPGFYRDSTANGEHGTLTDTDGDSTAAAGKIGVAYDFDGDADSIQMPGFSQHLTTAMTISGWVRPALTTPADNYGYFGLRQDPSVDHSFYILQLKNTSGDLEYRFRNSAGTPYAANIASAVSAGAWAYVVLTYDGDTLVSYIDGQLGAQEPAAEGSFSNPTYPFHIGQDGRSNMLDGTVDEVRVSDTARSACWIGASYNNQVWPDKAVTPTPDPSPNPSSGFYAVGAATAAGIADLALTKDDGAATAVPGAPISYTITVTNNGPDPVSSVTVTDPVPPAILSPSFSTANGVFTPGTGEWVFAAPLLVGQSTLLVLDGTIDPAATGTLTNTATVSPPPGVIDTNPGNDSDTDIDTLTPQTDLEVVKTGDVDPIDVGNLLTYTLSVENYGPSDATAVDVTDILVPELDYESAAPSQGACGYAAPTRTLTCTLGPIASGGSAVVTLVVRPKALGTLGNTASVAGNEPDPFPGNDTSTELTTVEITSDGVRFFTVTSTHETNVLEWLNPTGAYLSTEIVFRTDRFPTAPGEPGSTSLYDGGTAGTKDRLVHGTGAGSNAQTHYYAAFVHRSADPFLSSGRFCTGRPFDNSGPVRWAFSTGAFSITPPTVTAAAVVAPANDRALYAMERGAAGGEWPAGWEPAQLGGVVQARSSAIPLTVNGANPVVYLGAQDGNVYAVNGTMGGAAAFPWSPRSIAGVVQAAPAGIFSAWGGGHDYLLVGTRDEGADNALVALNPDTPGNVIGTFDNGGGLSGIGIISGMATVDYSTGRVYFTSRVSPTGSNGTLWCLQMGPPGPVLGLVWQRALGDIDGSPVLHGGRVYVGSAAGGGTVHSIDAATGSALGDRTFVHGDGAVKGFVWPDRASSDLYFATSTLVWGIEDTGAPSMPNKFAGGISLGGGVTPSIVLFVPGSHFVYTGGSDGRLYEIDVLPATPTLKSVVLGDGLARVGAPTLDWGNDLVHVGTEAGIFYAVDEPLP